MKQITVPALPVHLFHYYCPICGIELAESDFETFDRDYYCPSCGTQQRASRAAVPSR
jgi:rubredoxin